MNSVDRKIVVCAACAAAMVLVRPVVGRAESYDFVIQISVDGLRADFLQDLIATDTVGDFSNFARFMDEGVGTFNARTDFSHTNTLPNHVSMLSGRPVQRPAGQAVTVNHGYTSNSQPRSDWTLHNRGNLAVPYVASTFDVAHDNGLSPGNLRSGLLLEG